MPDVHATLGPSSANQWIHCPPSIKMGIEYGPPDTSTDYTREGTDAHSVCEYLLKTALGQKITDPRPSLHYYDQEMEECAEGYRDTVLELREQLSQKCKDVFVAVEQQVHFEEYVPGGFGTADCILIGDGEMYVVDFKYGKGVEVSATDNPQLKCYGLGAYLAYGPLYDIEKITLVIYQPRIGNFSRWSLSTEDLLSWAEAVLKPAADLASRGAGELASGPWCRFCKAKAICRKRAEENLALARYEFARPEVLEEDEINMILSQADEFEKWISDVRTYALHEALNGRIWDDFKVVEGRANRKFSDEGKAAAVLANAGYDPYEKKMKTITALEKEIGKKKFADLMDGLLTRPEGKPTLVPRTDKRPELMTNIKEEFSNE